MEHTKGMEAGNRRLNSRQRFFFGQTLKRKIKTFLWKRGNSFLVSICFPSAETNKKQWQKGAMELTSYILRKIPICDLKRGWKWKRMGRYWNSVCIFQLRVPTQSDLHTCVFISAQVRTIHNRALSIIVYWRSIHCNKLYATICFLTDVISIAYRHTAIRGPWPLHTWLIDVWPCLHVSALAVRDMLFW